MPFVCYLALANAAMAAVLACCVWVISQWVKRPTLLHLFWVLVLVRLLMPPIFIFQLDPLGHWVRSAAASATSDRTIEVLREAGLRQQAIVAMIQQVLDHSNMLPTRELIEQDEERDGPESSGVLAMDQSFIQMLGEAGTWLLRNQHILLICLFPIWLLGTVVCMTVQIYAFLHFRRRIQRNAYGSRIWQARMATVARRMGLRTCPQVLLVRAAISPMLWGFGKNTRVLFPERLLEKLDPRAQDTLLAHELAHYRRGDQWVRLLEMAATTLFWWNPVVWWARDRIEESEEICCDAWAVTQTNGCPRAYAEALLEAVDFVSVGLKALPPAASGAGGSRLIRERLKAIMSRNYDRVRLAPDGYIGVFLLAAIALPPFPALWPNNPTTIQALTAPTSVGPGARNSIADGGNQPTNKPPMRSPLAATPTAKLPPVDPDSLVAFAASGNYRVSVDKHQHAWLTSATANVDLGVGRVACVDFCDQRSTAAIGFLDGNIELFDCDSGKTIGSTSVGFAAITSLAFAPSGSQLVAGNSQGLCVRLNTKTLASTVIFEERGMRIDNVRYSHDGSELSILTSRHGRTHVEVRNVHSDKIVAELRGQNGIAAVVTPPTSARWMLVMSDGTIARPSWNAGKVLRTSRCVPDGGVLRLRFAPLADRELGSWKTTMRTN